MINFWEVGLNLLEKQLIYNSGLLLCFNNTTAKNIYWVLQTFSKFLNLFIIGNPGKICRGKSLAKENLNCHILEMKGHRKLTFGEDSLHIYQNFFDLNAFLRYIFLVK